MLVTEDGGKTWKAITDQTTQNQYKGIKWEVQGNFVAVQYNKKEIKVTG